MNSPLTGAPSTEFCPPSATYSAPIAPDTGGSSPARAPWAPTTASTATGAHEVHGAIREIWHGLGWEQSFLGYPLTDETVLARDNGRYNHFQGGSIYWSPATGAHEVHGATVSY